MSLNTYGTIRPATFTASDVEMLMVYQQNNVSTPETPTRLDAALVIETIDNPDNVNEMLGGLYNIKLNASLFAKGVGIYTIFIDNKKLNGGQITIRDCGVLEDVDIKGLLFDLNDLDGESQALFGQENALVGFKVEYFSTDLTQGEKLTPNVHRLVTGNYRVEPVSTSLGNNQSALGLRYKLNKASTLVFMTLTPDGVSDIDLSYSTFIGVPLQKVRISNTFFEPTVLRVNLVENDIDTIANGLFGDQTFNNEKSLRTFYDEDGEIFKQFDEYTVKDDFGNDIKKIKKERDQIDFTETLP
jgi:hypothetical protein